MKPENVVGRSWLLVSAVALGVAAILVLACSKDPAAAAEPPRVQPQGSADTQSQQAASVAPSADEQKPGAAAADSSAAEPPSVQLSSSDIQEANFGLKMKPEGPLKAGQLGKVLIELVAKAPFKVNQEYPYKFKVTEAHGLKLDSVIKKDNVALEKKRAVMTVPVTPESSGSKKLQGKFMFSVCTDEKCLIEKRDLGVALSVD